METDKFNLHEVILNSVKQVNADLEFFNQLAIARRPFDKILICGMGGSALIGDIFEYFKKNNFLPLTIKLPLQIHRSYGLPNNADQNTLIICVSYSGNTEETLSAYKFASQNNMEIAGITCGGELARLLQKDKKPWVKLSSKCVQPRLSLGYQLNALIKILTGYGLLQSQAQKELKSLPQSVKTRQIENMAKAFCHKLNHKIPVIYSSDRNQAISRIWKIKFNENTKIPAFFNVFPELNHNEMVGWTNAFGPFYFLMIFDPADLEQVQKRILLTAEILKRNGLPVEIIKLPKLSNPAEKLFWALNFSDWLSYHLAIFYGIDPGPVEMVEEFKKILNK